MPKLYYPFVIGIDWLSLYGHQKAEFVQEKNTIFSTEIEEYRTQQYSRRMIIKFNEGGKYIPFAEILFMPCVSSIHPSSCQLRVLNRGLYLPNWFSRLTHLLRSLPFAYRSMTRIDVYADFNKFYRGLLPATLIDNYIKAKFLKIGINNGYLSFKSMGYTIANNTAALPKDFTVNAAQYNGITWGHKGYAQTQLYNKTLELKEVKYKPWIVESWEQAGLDTGNVWRLEFRLQKAAKDIKFLDTDTEGQLSLMDLVEPQRIIGLFRMCVEKYARFVKRDYHVKKQDMNPIILFPQVCDYKTNIEFKIHQVKTTTNRTAKVVANVLNGLQTMLENGLVESRDLDLKYKLGGVVSFFDENFPSWMNPKGKSNSALLSTLEQQYIQRHLPNDIEVSPILFGSNTWGVLPSSYPERSESKQQHWEC